MQSIITDSTITLIADAGPSVIGKSHPNFYKIKKALLQKNFLEVEELLDVKNGYKEFSNGLIAVDGDNLIYNGTIVHNVLTQRIVEMIHNGDEANPMLNFLVNLMDNPSEGSIDQLYTFLEHENLPITEDGCFLAYKAIKRDYTDKYTGTISNKVGEKVKMPYEEVTADPKLHCSSGLHCGSIEYVRCYGNFSQDEEGNLNGDRLVTVKVNPSDVVSVPEDSNRQKVRVYRYVVHEEIENPFDLVPKYEAPVYYDDEDEDYDEFDEYDSWDEDEDEYDEDEVPFDKEAYNELKDLWGHPSGDLGGARVNVAGHDDSNLHSERGVEGEPGNPCEGLIDFDDPRRSESTLAGCIRQSTDNPLEKISVDSNESDVDLNVVNAMYNYESFEDQFLAEKKSVDSTESDKSELPKPPKVIILDSDLESNEESVVKIETPINIILPDNN